MIWLMTISIMSIICNSIIVFAGEYVAKNRPSALVQKTQKTQEMLYATKNAIKSHKKKGYNNEYQ